MNRNIINQVLVLFLMMAVGLYARKKNIIDEQINKGLSEFLIKITFPFMIVSSFNFKFSQELLQKSEMIILYSILIHGALILSSKILFVKYPMSKKSVLEFASVFSNSGFMGYPILLGIYGKIGVFYASIFIIPFNLLMWSYGVILFTGERNWKSLRKSILSPGIIATFIGIFLFLFSISLPAPIAKTLELIGSMTTPIAMVIIGVMLAELNFKEVFTGFTVYYETFISLVLSPVLAFAILKLIGADKTLLQICVILVAMPCASTVAVLSKQHGANSALASSCAFMTTIMSAITIPLVIMFV